MIAQSKEQLVNDYLYLIWKIAGRFRRPPGVDMEDLVQEGVLALLQCAGRFDPTKGFRFTTYLGSAAHKQMISYLYNCGYSLHVPSKDVPGLQEERNRAMGTASLDTLLADDHGCYSEPADPHNVAHESDVHLDAEEVWDTADVVLKPGDADFLQERMLGYTLAEIGRRHGVVRERARQRVSRAIQAIREFYELPS